MHVIIILLCDKIILNFQIFIKDFSLLSKHHKVMKTKNGPNKLLFINECGLRIGHKPNILLKEIAPNHFLSMNIYHFCEDFL